MKKIVLEEIIKGQIDGINIKYREKFWVMAGNFPNTAYSS